jgi:hypothetical protein
MAVDRQTTRTGFLIEEGQPLIAIPIEENGRDVVRYFTDDAAADAALPRSAIEEALAAIGSWSDLDWDDLERELHRIGHENPPTPPIDEV